MGRLLVITGPPGAGKSTVAQVVVSRFLRSVLVEGDSFFGFLAAGAIDPWLPHADPQNLVVQRATAAATAQFVEGGFMTVLEGILGPWHLPEFFAACGQREIDYAVLLPSSERCQERVANRTGHGFSDEPARVEMQQAFERCDLDARHILAEPPEVPTAVADEIMRRMDAGVLRYEAPGGT